jgi:DNA-binding GntR family transcriptional regulator
VQIGEPVLVVERRTKSGDNIPLLHTFFYYRSNEHEFQISLSRSKDSSLLPVVK